MRNIFIDEFDEVVLYKKPSDICEDLGKVVPANGDEFDPYIGVALAYCYECFGGKAEFRREVDKLRERCKNAKRERVYTLDDEQSGQHYFVIEEDRYGGV